MKTHALARQLVSLSKALKALPNMEIHDLASLPVGSPQLSNESLGMGLTTLVALSDIDKAKWRIFIEENGFPIEVRPRDASRDILGKLLTYLQNNRDARNKLAHTAARDKSTTSPELQRALQILLRS